MRKDYYDICPRCGAHLDPGEKCDCEEEQEEESEEKGEIHMNKALLDALTKHYARIYGNETEETEEIAEANKAFEEELEKHNFDFTTYNDIDCKASRVAAEHRFKGFIDGYSFCLTMMGLNREGQQ